MIGRGCPRAAFVALAFAGAVSGGAEAAAEAVDGASEFARHCQVCHGASGRGDGPYADKLTRRPKDLTGLARKNGGAFPETLVYRIVDGREIVVFHGPRDMPIWGDRFRAETSDRSEINRRIDALVRHVERLQVE